MENNYSRQVNSPPVIRPQSPQPYDVTYELDAARVKVKYSANTVSTTNKQLIRNLSSEQTYNRSTAVAYIPVPRSGLGGKYARSHAVAVAMANNHKKRGTKY